MPRKLFQPPRDCPAMERVVVAGIVLLLAASGVAVGFGLTAGDESAGPDDAPLPVDDSATEFDLDLFDMWPGDGIVVLAFQAQEDASYTLSYNFSFEGPIQDDALCALNTIVEDAPVEGIQAIRGGAPVPDDMAARGSASGQSMAGAPGSARVLDQQVRFASASAHMEARAGASGTLQAGEWILVQAGLHGVGRSDLEGSEQWRLELAATGAVEMVRLPDAPLLCGSGFGGDASTPASAPSAYTGGRFSLDAQWGAFASFHDAPGSDPAGSQARSARLSILDEESELPGGGCAHRSAWGPGEVRIDVDHWLGSDPLWMLAGVWVPTGPGGC